MKKLDFLAALRSRLSGLPAADIDSTVSYYSEMIADRMEDGVPEEEAVAAVGTPEEIANQVFRDTPLPKLVKETIKPKRPLRTWEIVLIAVGSPVWAPLLLAAAIVILAVYAVNWAVVVCMYASGGTVAGCAAGCMSIAVSFFMNGDLPQAVTVFGGGLILVGLAILAFTGSTAAAKGLVRLVRLLVRVIKSCFIRKGNTK